MVYTFTRAVLALHYPYRPLISEPHICHAQLEVPRKRSGRSGASPTVASDIENADAVYDDTGHLIPVTHPSLPVLVSEDARLSSEHGPLPPVSAKNDPWSKSIDERLPDLPPRLVVFDALDELRVLLDVVQRGGLPGLKFLVTSRPGDHAVCYLHEDARTFLPVRKEPRAPSSNRLVVCSSICPEKEQEDVADRRTPTLSCWMMKVFS